MKVGNLVRLKDRDQAWNDGIGLILSIERKVGWKDLQASVYWSSENKAWSFSVKELEVVQ